jgi:cobalamin biosynthesis Co2+ chelatase CbiK
MSDEQKNKLYSALGRYETEFNIMPFFDGMGEEEMLDDSFIDKVNKAVDENNPEIDLSDYFPEGRNI